MTRTRRDANPQLPDRNSAGQPHSQHFEAGDLLPNLYRPNHHRTLVEAEQELALSVG